MDNGCSIINALALFDCRLELYMREHPDSIMIDLIPTHFMIGSTPESTRLGHPTEIDVSTQLQGLNPEYFQRKNWILLVTPMGKTFFSKF